MTDQTTKTEVDSISSDFNGFATFDNINHRLIDDLKVQLKAGGKLQIAAASFSIYAYEALKEELENIQELQFIFTSPTFNSSETGKKEKREFFIPKLNRERNLYGSDYEIRLRNQLSQKAIARECADWIRRKVRFKTNTTPESRLDGFLNLKNADSSFTYLPFNELTTTELGCNRGNNISPGVNRITNDTGLGRPNVIYDPLRCFAAIVRMVSYRGKGSIWTEAAKYRNERRKASGRSNFLQLGEIFFCAHNTFWLYLDRCVSILTKNTRYNRLFVQIS